jgi:hypothetical protein
MIVVMGCALDVRGGEILFDGDLQLFLGNMLGGVTTTTTMKSFPNDLGGLRLRQKRGIAKRWYHYIRRNVLRTKGTNIEIKGSIAGCSAGN